MLSELGPFFVIGIVTGSVYGLAGTGLVLTYKTSGIFNFAHGAVAAAAAYIFYWLNVDHGLPWYYSAFISIVVLGVVLGYALERMGRRLALQSTSMKVVGTIGVILVVQGLSTVKYGTDALIIRQFLPHARTNVTIGGVFVSVAQIITVIISLVAVVALYLLFRFTRIGLRMRAVVDDPDLVGLHSVSAIRTRRVSWVIGATFAAMSGVLLAPSLGIQAITLVYLVAQAFGAIAIGAFRSIPMTYAGGLVIGICASVATKYAPQHQWLSGLPAGLPFILLLIVLIILPRRYLQARATAVVIPSPTWRAPTPMQITVGVLSLAFLALVPRFSGTHISFFTIGVTQAILILSLGLLVRTGGILSLCHAAFAAIGAVAFAQLMANAHLPWVLAVVVGALIVVPIAAAVSIIAVRLSGIFLALATFGFGLFLQQMFYSQSYMFSSLAQGREMPRPSFGQSDTGYYYVCAVVLVLVAIVTVLIQRARLGRMLRGIGEAPLAVSTAGLNVPVARVLVFSIAGALAGLGGILYGGSVHFVTIADPRFDSFQSLLLVAILAVSPFREPWYALIAAIAAVIPGYISGASTPYWLNVVFGAAAIVISMQLRQPGVPLKLRNAVERAVGGGRRRRASFELAGVPTVGGPRRSLAGSQRVISDKSLVVESIVVRFSGHVAVDHVSLRAPVGKITGLIGPNGAGKTTLFNACSGLLRPASGRVLFGDQDVTHMAVARRAASGIGRTFQLMQLCESLTVQENVALGREAGFAGSNPLAQIISTRGQRRLIDEATRDAMEMTDIWHLRHQQAGNLSTGERRLVELARCLAGRYEVILLDEPSSGLDRRETAGFADILRRVVAERGCGILIVEHDMSLVLNICDEIYVVDFGALLASGSRDEIANSQVVKAAYFGSDDPVIEEALAE